MSVLAFYLPQFHRISENDEWWGEGFTEWTNVKRATPMFEGHFQPRAPLNDDYYDLGDDKVHHQQCRLAAAAGIDAFVYYHYWFDGHRLLEMPLNARLTSSEKMPFAICWANENWTRRWDGKDHEVLMPQTYSNDWAEEVFASFLPYMRDPRYFQQSGKRVLLVHRANQLPNASDVTRLWRTRARERGLGDLYIIAAETESTFAAHRHGFDAVVQFPPVGDATWRNRLARKPSGVAKDFRGRLLDYRRVAERRLKAAAHASQRTHPGVMPGWDNTPRRMERATILVGNDPEHYRRWLEQALRIESKHDSMNMVFINAWNEWAEGAYLEPDARYGSAYLDATRAAILGNDFTVAAELAATPTRMSKTPNLISAHRLIGASLVARTRRVRSRRE